MLIGEEKGLNCCISTTGPAVHEAAHPDHRTSDALALKREDLISSYWVPSAVSSIGLKQREPKFILN